MSGDRRRPSAPWPENRGVVLAIAAAVLFGASTPLSKILLGRLDPILLAGLLYLSSGVGLELWRRVQARSGGRTSQQAPLKRADLPWLGGAIVTGGVAAPVLLLLGLATTPASAASLLLNLEGVPTAALAWLVFKESFDRRIALGMAAITAGGALLSWAGRPALGAPWGALAIIGACFAWGIDNNLTRRISAGDPVQIAAAKGLAAGLLNVTVALVRGAPIPSLSLIPMAALLGFLGYGVSLTLFVLALRHIGAARTSAYFSLAPFVGAGGSVLLLGDPLSPHFLIAAALMAVGVWLHVTERHEHEHEHPLIEHEHQHEHDEHHQHAHGDGDPPGEPHSHAHVHPPLLHAHPHYPDIHHRHSH
jgi:drug/metabolite transporter (DMT)-like permease